MSRWSFCKYYSNLVEQKNFPWFNYLQQLKLLHNFSNQLFKTFSMTFSFNKKLFLGLNLRVSLLQFSKAQVQYWLKECLKKPLRCLRFFEKSYQFVEVLTHFESFLCSLKHWKQHIDCWNLKISSTEFWNISFKNFLIEFLKFSHNV